MYECMYVMYVGTHVYVVCNHHNGRSSQIMFLFLAYVQYVRTRVVHCASQFTSVVSYIHVARSINNLQIFFRTIERQ